MSIYTTPLQFGYFFGLLFAVLLWYRGWREERLADTLLGCVLLLLAMKIQDYTFGFAGINILWEELNGFPRYFPWVFAAAIYFYFQAQTNREFHFRLRDIWHLLPYLVYFIFNLLIFLQGATFVKNYQSSTWHYIAEWVVVLTVWTSYFYYFRKVLEAYKAYKTWIATQYANTEALDLVWLRNFIYLIMAGEAFYWIWNVIDIIMGDLPYEQDWWWQLFTIVIIIYVAIKGYTRPEQQNHIKYDAQNHELSTATEDNTGIGDIKDVAERNFSVNTDLVVRLEQVMKDEKAYLHTDISLNDLALRLKTNTSALSATINQHYQKNFNDFINAYRIADFDAAIDNPKNAHLTLLAIAFDCGFNSKATFNRAYKKVHGYAPSQR